MPSHRIRLIEAHFELEQHQLALQVLAERHVLYTDYIDQLVELVDDLLNRGIRPLRNERDTGDARLLRGGNGQRLDVVPAGGEQAGDAAQGTGFVLQENRDDVAHPARLI